MHGSQIMPPVNCALVQNRAQIEHKIDTCYLVAGVGAWTGRSTRCPVYQHRAPEGCSASSTLQSMEQADMRVGGENGAMEPAGLSVPTDGTMRQPLVLNYTTKRYTNNVPSTLETP